MNIYIPFGYFPCKGETHNEPFSKMVCKEIMISLTVTKLKLTKENGFVAVLEQ
jgi:hypothetical protein